ncbi:MAG: FAD-binding oxidoreductase [Acidimicrobiales bacterium]|nr:FAD-binding oxidoreductase [Acidimicrobiales bacterium]
MAERVVVVGGGIAGASAAAFLSENADFHVTLVEQERNLAHHTTGRSAAQWIQNYGVPATRALTKASFDFFASPPEGLVDSALLHDRAVLLIGNEHQEEGFRELLAAGQDSVPPARQLTPEEAAVLNPGVDPETTAFVMIEDGSFDIDVAATHQAFVRMLKRNSGTIATSTKVNAATPTADRWSVHTTAGPIVADYLVNAAGAWGDVVAEAAGIQPVGLQPRRRTAFMVNGSALPDADMSRSSEWPMLINVAHDWYVKPDGQQFLCSPADQTPSEPMDARPEELDIARAIDIINKYTRFQIRSVVSSWAGLRTFAPDESMVIGPDPANRRFIWCVGQGGTGIQTSPAAGRLTALLTSCEQLPIDLAAVDLAAILADRFR